PSGAGDVPARAHRPLQGVRVLDLGVIVVGAELGRLFADQGAEVIKIENRAFPDGSRQSRDGATMSPSFAWGHRNKLSLGLDLRSPQGVAVFKRLAATADVVLSNFKPGTMESLGLGDQSLRTINPRLIVVDSSAFGSSGPWSPRMGYGPLVRAATAITGLWRYPDVPDSFSDSSTIYPDHVAARVGAVAVLATLLARRRCGIGGTVSFAQAETILTQLSAQFLCESLAPGSLAARGDVGGHDAPYGVYPCAGDDEWCVLTIRGDEDWRRLCRAIGRPELCDDPRLASAAGRRRHRVEVEQAVTAWTAVHPPREAMSRLQHAGVPAGMMQRVADLPDDPHLAARGFFRRLAQPQLPEPILTENGPAVFTGIADPQLRPAPLQGEHTREICAKLLGLSDCDIDALVAAGVLEEPR
ncbi:CaiB/BaiF CoA-transferase family protein, partial [Frankia sp. Cr1]|uniref:CaiB/BaiF CoA transferase family protein n=1 Tax=Frankia sp. Cr1 TaxID=3073931 RepID=UPI002AD52077